MASVFTRILKGELPGFKVFEDDLTFAILALDQVNPGHTLVIPKREFDSFIDTPEPEYTRVFTNAKRISQVLRLVTGAPRIATVIAGFEVPHFHFHLIPAWGIPDIDFKRAKRLPEDQMKSLQIKISSQLV